jgi:transposase-like protein
VMLRSASHNSLIAASSLGKWPRVLMSFLSCVIHRHRFTFGISKWSDTMEADIRKRMAWIRLYQRIGTAGVVCRRCGVSRPTLRKWLRRYEQGGPEALVSRSRRPHTHPGSRIDRQIGAMIVDMRMDRRFGVRRLRCELLRQHNTHLSPASIHKCSFETSCRD